MTNKICVAVDATANTFHPILFYPSPKPSEYDDEYWRHYSYAHLTDGFESAVEAINWAVEHAKEDDNLEYADVTVVVDGMTGGSMVYYFKR